MKAVARQVQDFSQCVITRRELLLGGATLLATASVTRLFAARGVLPVAGLDHVNIRVPNVQRAAEFYASLFGSDLSRTESAVANPSSIRGQLWFMRLGQTVLAISPTAPGQRAGLDHFCLAIQGFDGQAMKSRLTEFDPQWVDTPPSNLWVKDPAGHIIQMTPRGDESRPPGAAVGAVLVGRPASAKSEPAFQVTRITKLTLAVPRFEESAAYYHKFLGDEAETPQKGTFRVGQAELILGPVSGGDHFRVGVAGFDLTAGLRKLKELGVAAEATRSKDAISFRDSDDINVEIGL